MGHTGRRSGGQPRGRPPEEGRIAIWSSSASRSVAPLPEHAVEHERDLGVVGTKHVAFGTANPEAVHAELERRAVAGLTPIFDGTYYKYFFFKDPDGIVLEIVSRKREGLGNAAANESESAKLE